MPQRARLVHLRLQVSSESCAKQIFKLVRNRFAATSIGPESAKETHVPTAIFVTAATAHTPDVIVQSIKGHEQTKTVRPTASAIPTELNANNVRKYLIPTPIVVTKLEDTLAGHANPQFVSQLCDNLRYGARIGFDGQRIPRFSKKKKIAYRLYPSKHCHFKFGKRYLSWPRGWSIRYPTVYYFSSLPN